MKLLLIAPCEKVIEDARSGHSLISVFHEIVVAIENAVLPPNAVIPKEWAIFSKWQLSPEEFGHDFTSNFEFYWPDGALFAKQSIVAAQPTKDGMSFVVNLQGFPIGKTGSIRVVNSLESAGVVVHEPIELTVSVSTVKTLGQTGLGITSPQIP